MSLKKSAKTSIKKNKDSETSPKKTNNLASALMQQPKDSITELESEADEFTVWIDHDDIIRNPLNEEEIKDIPELKTSIITAGGILHNIVVLPKENGKYMLLAGERRWTAVGELINEGYDKFRKLPAHIKSLDDMSPEALQMSEEWRSRYLIVTSNIENREDKTEAATYRRYVQMKNLYDEWKAAGVKPPGKIRELIAEEMHINPRTVAKFEQVSKNATEEIQDAVKEGNITISGAMELAKTPKEEQTAVLEKAKEEKRQQIESATDDKERAEASSKPIGGREIEKAVIENYSETNKGSSTREEYKANQTAPKMSQPVKVTEDEISETVELLKETVDCLQQLSGKEVPQSLYNTIQRCRKNLISGAKTITKIVTPD